MEAIAHAEAKANGPGDIALTHRQLVKQMILDSPLASVRDITPLGGIVNVAIAHSYLKRLVEAVEAL